MDKFLDLPKWQLALLSGVLIGAAYPPSPLGFLAWFGFVPLIHLLYNASPVEGAKWSFLTGVTVNIITVYWFGLNSGAGLFPVFLSLTGAVLYLSIYWIIFGMCTSWYHQRTGYGLAVLPIFWVGMEYIRSYGPLAFPWINLALTQTFSLPLLQIADVTGSTGISFWIVLINAILYAGYGSSIGLKNSLKIVTLLLVLISSLGVYRISSIRNETIVDQISIAIVQPNIDPNQKWEADFRDKIFDIMDSLHTESIDLQPDLILWPEAALPVYLRITYAARRPILRKVRDSGIPLLTGTPDRINRENNERDYYNGALYFTPDGSMKMYYKMHLVPFAEYIPFSEKFPILKRLNFGQGNFTSGRDFTLFEVDSVPFGNLICYESSIPTIVSQFVRHGAKFLSIETNDSWCGHTSGVYQHFQIARLRAVENRVAIARSANTGISSLILPTGEIAKKIPYNEQKIILAEIPIRDLASFYMRFGELFAIICSLISIILLGIGCVKNRS